MGFERAGLRCPDYGSKEQTVTQQEGATSAYCHGKRDEEEIAQAHAERGITGKAGDTRGIEFLVDLSTCPKGESMQESCNTYTMCLRLVITDEPTEEEWCRLNNTEGRNAVHNDGRKNEVLSPARKV